MADDLGWKEGLNVGSSRAEGTAHNVVDQNAHRTTAERCLANSIALIQTSLSPMTEFFLRVVTSFFQP